MRRRMIGVLSGAMALALTPFLSLAANAAPTSASPHRSCAVAQRGAASCGALVRGDTAQSAAAVRAAGVPKGLGPADLQSAYRLPSATAGSGQTVAIVDAYNDPTAEADMGVYRTQFGLPACTSATGCFRKVDQTGGTMYPPTDAGWAQEISLDLDMVSAVCPRCKIVLVEAKTASFANLGTAENTAASLAGVISNSYGGPDASDATYASYYNHPGHAITASSGGDGSGGVEYPASSHYVTAVGGTSLRYSSATRSWTETGYGTGGCSVYNAALTAQAGVGTLCPRRAVADVAAVADPATGVAVYDSTPAGGASGWLVFGGTSVSSPIIAGVYGLAGNAATIDDNYPYTHASSLFDITSGPGGVCTPAKWCTAGPGWDGPTGMGTPNGVGAF